MTNSHQQIDQYLKSCCRRLINNIILKTMIHFIKNIAHFINRYWNYSIQRQLVLGIALVHAVLMTIFILDLTQRERHFLENQSIRQAIALSEMLGGKVSVESELGKGSTFTVHFPTRIASRQMIPEVHEVSHAEFPPELSTVLVIDDDPNVRDLLSKHIRQLGYQVHTAASGKQGLELAQELKPQLITLDVMMPQMDGWAVLSELKSKPHLQNIPVVMLSMVENQELGYSLGAAEYLIKPVEQHKIAQVLTKYRSTPHCGQALVIEDDVMIRDMVKQMLHKDGWEVALASNGKVALERMKTVKPDVILLDLMMPEMDGYEFISQLREHKPHRKIPIVVLTAKDVTSHDRQALSEEVHAIFQKGAYKREELLNELHELLISTES